MCVRGVLDAERVTEEFFSGEKITFFWNLNGATVSARCQPYNCQNVPERSCANDDVICVITSTLEDNYIPIEQLTFQSVAAHRPTSLS